mgnify:CR=1 FL=1
MLETQNGKNTVTKLIFSSRGFPKNRKILPNFYRTIEQKKFSNFTNCTQKSYYSRIFLFVVIVKWQIKMLAKQIQILTKKPQNTPKRLPDNWAKFFL